MEVKALKEARSNNFVINKEEVDPRIEKAYNYLQIVSYVVKEKLKQAMTTKKHTLSSIAKESKEESKTVPPLEIKEAKKFKSSKEQKNVNFDLVPP